MSKSFLDSMLPSYTQFQPFTSSTLSSVASLINLNNNNNNNNCNSINNNTSSGNSTNNYNHSAQRNAGINLSLATSTTSDSGSLANSEDGNSSNSPTSLVNSTQDQSSANSSTLINKIAHKMYPYVSNHPSSHGSLSGMPGFTGLEDKSCR